MILMVGVLRWLLTLALPFVYGGVALGHMGKSR